MPTVAVRLLVAMLGAGLSAAGCRRTAPPQVQPPVPRGEAGAQGRDGSEGDAAPDGKAPAREAGPADVEAPSPPPHDPHGFGHRCQDDEGCAWDHPCVPTRCVAAEHVDSRIRCAETLQQPGECRCVEGQCALMPRELPPRPEAPCKVGQCGLDVGGGRCLVGEGGPANHRMLRVEGPMCECDAESRCQLRWVGPVPCKRRQDCWLRLGPRPHPIAPPAQRDRRPDHWGRPCTGRSCMEGDFGVSCRDGRCEVMNYIR